MRRNTLFLAGFAFAISATAILACTSDDSNPVPSTPVYNVTGDGSAPSSTDAGSTDAAVITDANVVDAPVVDATGCVSDSGCWSCAPVSIANFLNQCTGSSCTPFNNFARLPGYDGGALPPLNP